MKKNLTTLELKELWEKLHQKFCVDLKNDFSNKNVKGWLNHFMPNEKINIYQHNKGKTTKIYTGNLLKSIINGRIPAKLMANVYFQKLAKQNYSYSNIDLLGIQHDPENNKLVKVHIKFFRYDTLGKMYESAVGIYTLNKVANSWLIKEMSIYADNDQIVSKINLSEMWHPESI